MCIVTVVTTLLVKFIVASGRPQEILRSQKKHNVDGIKDFCNFKNCKYRSVGDFAQPYNVNLATQPVTPVGVVRLPV